MARMMESLAVKSPNSVNMFLSDIMYHYGIGVNEFESKTLGNRYIEIKRYFGYSREFSDEMTTTEIQDDIRRMFEDYEELMHRYPNGVPNKLKAINIMSNEEKSKYIAENETRLINMCLHHAIVAKTHSYGLSLKDAIVSRIMSMVEQITSERLRKERADELFWQSVKADFLKDELPPF